MSIKTAIISSLKFCLPSKLKLALWLVLSGIMLGQYHEEFISIKGDKHRPQLIKVEWYGKPVVYYKKENKPGVIYPGRLALVLSFSWAAVLATLAIFLYLNKIVGGVHYRYKILLWLAVLGLMLSQYRHDVISETSVRAATKYIKVEWYGKPVVYYKKQNAPGVIYPGRLALVLVFAWGISLYLLSILLLLNRITSCLHYRYKILIWVALVSIMLSQYHVETISDKGSGAENQLIKVEWYGKPVVYYKKQGRPGVLYPVRLALVLVFAWAAILSVLAIVLLINKSVSGLSLLQRDKILIGLVAVVALPYLVIYISGTNFLVNAVVKRDQWQVRLLTQLGIKPNRLSTDNIDFPLKAAAWNKDKRMVKKLVRLGADVTMINRYGDTALHSAAYRNAVAVARYLIRKGANVNAIGKDGNTPLHRARHVAMVKLLLDNGARINQRNNNHRTPIFTDKNPDSISLLISRGAKLNLSDKRGNTVLHYLHEPRDIALLVKAGANVNHRNIQGQTPLHMLVPADKSSFLYAPLVAQRLIKHGANPDITDNTGMSPLHYAIRFCNPQARARSTITTGKILFKASSEVRLQLSKRKLNGQLASVVKQNSAGCWKEIAGKKANLLLK